MPPDLESNYLQDKQYYIYSTNGELQPVKTPIVTSAISEESNNELIDFYKTIKNNDTVEISFITTHKQNRKCQKFFHTLFNKAKRGIRHSKRIKEKQRRMKLKGFINV